MTGSYTYKDLDYYTGYTKTVYCEKEYIIYPKCKNEIFLRLKKYD